MMNKVFSVIVVILATIWTFNGDFQDEEELYKKDEFLQPPPAWIAELTAKVTGRVLLPSDPEYLNITKVHNGVCINRPDVVVVPSNERDVVEVVLLVVSHELELSVRSGGHSYTCTSSKVGGLHLDMRGLARVDLHSSIVSHTG